MSKKAILILIILLLAGAVTLAINFLGNDDKEQQPVPEVVVENTVFEVTVQNVSRYHIAPGVFLAHKPNFSIDFTGENAPEEYELLAEVGNPDEVLASLETAENVDILEKTPLLGPGDSVSYPVSDPDARVSFMGMIVETNDAVVLFEGRVSDEPEAGNPFVDLVSDFDTFDYYETNTLPEERYTFVGQVLDMGTEENSPIGSGFDGGQPDESRGEENIENGVSERKPVAIHGQFEKGVPIITINIEELAVTSPTN